MLPDKIEVNSKNMLSNEQLLNMSEEELQLLMGKMVRGEDIDQISN